MTDQELALWLALAVVASLAVPFTVLAVVRRRRDRILAGPMVTATVTASEQRMAGRAGPVNDTRLRFVTAAGETVEARLVAPRRTRFYEVGERVMLRHDAARPKRFLIVGDDHAYRRLRFVVIATVAFDAILLAVIGLFLAGVIGPFD